VSLNRKPRLAQCGAFPSNATPCVQLGGAHLATLRRLADAIEGRENEIATLWERSYALTFGHRAYHCLQDFVGEARAEIREVFDYVRSGDCHGMSVWFADRGRQLFEAGVPYSEVCRSLHLFEESIIDVIRRDDRSAEDVLELFSALDHLSHERLILMAEAYHNTCHLRWQHKEQALITEVARRERDRRERLCGLVGRSAPMQEVYERLNLAAGSRETVLLVGDTGTGKDLAARTIHALSGDPPERFVPVNCAALSHDLIESELFGHRRGSFTGAQSDHPGLFRAAQGGTLFLDVRPVGGIEEIEVTARIVASTNRDLDEAIDEGLVRRDLYYRLRQLVVPLPLLRDRAEDLPLLSRHFAEKAAEDGLCSRPPSLTPEGLSRLASHRWPGNVRELESVIRLACQRAKSGQLEADHLVLDGTPEPAGSLRPEDDRPPISMRDAEHEAIRRALDATQGNKTQAARVLGISRKQLYAKIRAFGL
jgi:transcriptional regulator with PAS, ATPase and Fis domain